MQGSVAGFTLAFLAGILLLVSLPALPSAIWLILLLPCVLLAWRVPALRWLTPLLLGFVWAGWQAQLQLADQLPESLAGRDLTISGRIVSIPEPQPHGTRFLFAPDSAARAATPGLPSHLRLNWYYANQTPAAGEDWQLTVRLKPPRGFVNPGNFDYEAWLFRQGIGATGYVRDAPPARRLAPASPSVLRLRAAIVQQIRTALGARPAMPLVAGLAVGYDAQISDTQWQVLRQTGISHLMAISGLHVSMLAALVFILVRALWRRLPGLCKRVPAVCAATVIGWLTALAYALLAGWSIPTQRTLLMLAVVAGAVLWRRPLRTWQGLALAGGAVLIVDPLAVLDAGFWLSFGAVAVIVFALGQRLEPVARPGPWQRLQTFGRLQLAVTLGLAPLLLALFGAVPVAGLVANLIAIPLFNLLVVPLVLLGVVLPQGGWAWQIAAWLLETLWPALEWLAAQAPPLQGSGTAWGLGLALVGLLFWLAPRGIPGRWLGVAWCLPLLLAVPAAPPPGSFRLAVLDVGQGLAVVVETAGHTLLYDTGPRFGSGASTAELVLMPYLATRHRRPDLLVISHSDLDHAGGVPALRRHWPGLPQVSGTPGSGTPACAAGQGWQWDGVQFEFLHPAVAPILRSDNNHSCVLRIRAGGQSVLLTGDIEARAEAALLRHTPDLHARVLVVPHHGSAGASSAAFVQAVQPDYAVVSAGYHNRWDFPRPPVVARYRASGARLLNTARDGALLFLVSPEDVRLEARWRQADARLWRKY